MNLFIIGISMPGAGEMIIILVIVLLLFGGRKIPELMKGLGKGLRDFKDASKEDPEADKKGSEKIEN